MFESEHTLSVKDLSLSKKDEGKNQSTTERAPLHLLSEDQNLLDPMTFAPIKPR
jgi:hypothetical protein